MSRFESRSKSTDRTAQEEFGKEPSAEDADEAGRQLASYQTKALSSKEFFVSPRTV
jgi:hypothetical protein